MTVYNVVRTTDFLVQTVHVVRVRLDTVSTVCTLEPPPTSLIGCEYRYAMTNKRFDSDDYSAASSHGRLILPYGIVGLRTVGGVTNSFTMPTGQLTNLSKPAVRKKGCSALEEHQQIFIVRDNRDILSTATIRAPSSCSSLILNPTDPTLEHRDFATLCSSALLASRLEK
jgi:hypothetical protein